ncbi:MAG: oligosaccharide flippase family protein [bacterium]
MVKDKIREIIGVENIEFLTHAKNYLSSQFIIAALGLISVPIFTRLLSRSEYGLLAVFGSLTTIFTIFLGLNIQGSVNRYYHEKTHDFDSFLGSNIVFMAVFNAVLVAVLYFFAGAIARAVRVESNLLLAAVLLSAATIPTSMLLAYLMAAKQSKKYAFFEVLKRAAMLAVAVAWVWSLAENRYWGKVYASLAVTGLFSVYALYRLAKTSRISLDLQHVKYSLKFGVPLIPHALSATALTYFDRIIINQLVGSSDTGLYHVACRVGMAMEAVIMATNRAWVPIFYKAMREGAYEKIGRLASNYARYIYFCSIGLILFSREIVVLLADRAFHSAMHLVPVIILGYVFLFLYTLYAGFSFYRKKTTLISLNTMIACGANIGLNYWLIPQFGYSAAAYTTLASYLLLFALHYLNVRLVLKEAAIPLARVLPGLFLVCASVACLALISQYISVGWLKFSAKFAFVSFAGYWLLLRKRHGSDPADRQVPGVRG